MNLRREISLLYKSEAQYKIPAAPVIRALIADMERPLPDCFPLPPEPVVFQWPNSGEVDFRSYWQQVDRGMI